MALDFLACGLDPKRSVFFRQSDVPEVTELTWMLSHASRRWDCWSAATAYKDKVGQGHPVNHGLFAYPVLMAADILIYDSNVVPVGQDQKQHVEVTRDIAIKFNEQYGQTFVIPEPQIRGEVAKVPGLDGEKMSKSYGNAIEIFGDEKALRKKIMGIKMDSRAPAGTEAGCGEEPGDPIAETGRAGGGGEGFRGSAAGRRLGYGDLKKALFEHYWNYFAAARAKARRTGWRTGLREWSLAGRGGEGAGKARESLAADRKAAAGLE